MMKGDDRRTTRQGSRSAMPASWLLLRGTPHVVNSDDVRCQILKYPEHPGIEGLGPLSGGDSCPNMRLHIPGRTPPRVPAGTGAIRSRLVADRGDRADGHRAHLWWPAPVLRSRRRVTGTHHVTPSTGLSNGTIGRGHRERLHCQLDRQSPRVQQRSQRTDGHPRSAYQQRCRGGLHCTIAHTARADGSTGAIKAGTTFKVVQGTVGPPCGAAPAAVTCPATDSGGQTPDR